MPFGIGGSSSRTQSQAQSTSESGTYGYSGSASQGTSGQEVFGADAFNQLFAGAGGATADIAGSTFLSDTANQLFGGGTQFLEQMKIGGGPSDQYMKSVMEGTGPSAADARIDTLRGDVGRLFSEELNPEITNQAIGAGQLGGGRQGVAQSGAMARLGESFARESSAIRGRDVERRDEAARGLFQNQLGAAQVAGQGIGQIGSLYDIAESGQFSGLEGYGRLSDILGGPTALSSSQQSAQAMAENSAYSTTQSTASSKGKSKSFSFGL